MLKLKDIDDGMRLDELDKALEGVITFEAAELAAEKIMDTYMEKDQMAKTITIAIWEAFESIQKER